MPELRHRVLFTAMILALYRLRELDPGAGRRLGRRSRTYFSSQGGTVLGLLEPLLGQRALGQFSLFALGIMPYVTASIILQLMTVVDPAARAAAEGG